MVPGVVVGDALDGRDGGLGVAFPVEGGCGLLVLCCCGYLVWFGVDCAAAGVVVVGWFVVFGVGKGVGGQGVDVHRVWDSGTAVCRGGEERGVGVMVDRVACEGVAVGDGGLAAVWEGVGGGRDLGLRVGRVGVLVLLMEVRSVVVVVIVGGGFGVSALAFVAPEDV